MKGCNVGNDRDEFNYGLYKDYYLYYTVLSVMVWV